MKMGKEKLDYNQIDEHVYIGTNMCCSIALDPVLVKKGITADISLEENRVDAPIGVDYYVWLPTRDHTAPRMDKLIYGIMSIDYFVRNGVKVFVHCKAGHTRAPTLVAAYFMYKNNWTARKAEQFVKSKRPAMHLSDVQKAALRKLEKKLGITRGAK